MPMPSGSTFFSFARTRLFKCSRLDIPKSQIGTPHQQQRSNEQNASNNENSECNGALHENGEASIGNGHGLDEGSFRKRAEHETQNERDERPLAHLQKISRDAENKCDKHAAHAVAHQICTADTKKKNDALKHR